MKPHQKKCNQKNVQIKPIIKLTRQQMKPYKSGEQGLRRNSAFLRKKKERKEHRKKKEKNSEIISHYIMLLLGFFFWCFFSFLCKDLFSPVMIS
jgi:hypothetical protein